MKLFIIDDKSRTNVLLRNYIPLLPLAIGAVDDIDKPFNTLNNKMSAAGVDKAKAELEAQAAEIIKTKGKLPAD